MLAIPIPWSALGKIIHLKYIIISEARIFYASEHHVCIVKFEKTNIWTKIKNDSIHDLICESPIAYSPIVDLNCPRIPRHSRGLFAVRVSPRKSAKDPAADFRGLVKIGLNANPQTLGSKLGNILWKLSDIPRKSANVREILRQDYSRTFEDLSAQQKVRESVAEFHGLLMTALIRKCPWSDFPRSDFRGKDFSHFRERACLSNVVPMYYVENRLQRIYLLHYCINRNYALRCPMSIWALT